MVQILAILLTVHIFLDEDILVSVLCYAVKVSSIYDAKYTYSTTTIVGSDENTTHITLMNKCLHAPFVVAKVGFVYSSDRIYLY